MTGESREVVVVGGSIAGCRAALSLARRGVDVLLLDKSSFPRWKPCAGGVTRKARPLIPAELRSRFESTMRGTRLTYGDRFVTRVVSDSAVGWMVHRESFDEAFLNLVGEEPHAKVETGIRVRNLSRERDSVAIETDSGVVRASAVIGADGVNGVVSKALPGHDEREIGFAFEGEAHCVQPRLTDEVVFDFKTFDGGYGWIFPKRDHYSIGGYAYDAKLKEIRSRYDEYCADSALLSDCDTYRRKGHRIPHGGDSRRVNAERIVLAGDAAGLVDPLTGEGIYYALRSGQLAAEHVESFLRRGESLDGYGDRVRDEIQHDLRTARRFAGLAYRHNRAAYFLLFRSPPVCRWLIEVLVGRKRYSDVAPALKKRAWSLPFRARLPFRREVTVELGEI